MLFVAAVFTNTACTKTLDAIDNIIFPEVLRWSLEFEVNGELYKCAIHEKQGIRILSYLPWDVFQYCRVAYCVPNTNRSVINIPHDADVLDDGNTLGIGSLFCKPMSLELYLPRRLFLLLYTDGSTPFIEGKEYTFNDECIAFYGDDKFSLFSDDSLFKCELLNGKYSITRSYKLGFGNVLNVYFEFENRITELPEWYQGDLYVGEIIKVSNGHYLQAPLPKEWEEYRQSIEKVMITKKR